MADIINLNKFRKRREREQERARASENRVRHGRPLIELQRDAAERARQRKALKDKHLDRGPASGDPSKKND